jgi:membrane-bound lytic murein transglycosylase D
VPKIRFSALCALLLIGGRLMIRTTRSKRGQNLLAVKVATLIVFLSAPSLTLAQSSAEISDGPLQPAPAEGSVQEERERLDNDGVTDPAKAAPEKTTESGPEEPVGTEMVKPAEQPKQQHRIQFSKEVLRHPKVRYFIDYFTKRARPYFEQALARAGRYLPMITNVLSEAGLPQELAYLAMVESSFRPDAKSSEGAVGLWQFMPRTARMYGLRVDQWVDERRDPEKATRAALAYLKELHDYYGHWYLATAAYNAGPGTIDRALRSSRGKDFWRINTHISQETRDYVPKFIAIAAIAVQPELFGLGQISYEAPLNYEEIEVSAPFKLDALANLTDADPATLRELNPALLRWRIPPGAKAYLLRVPLGKAALLAARTINSPRG